MSNPSRMCRLIRNLVQARVGVSRDSLVRRRAHEVLRGQLARGGGTTQLFTAASGTTDSAWIRTGTKTLARLSAPSSSCQLRHVCSGELWHIHLLSATSSLEPPRAAAQVATRICSPTAARRISRLESRQLCFPLLARLPGATAASAPSPSRTVASAPMLPSYLPLSAITAPIAFTARTV